MADFTNNELAILKGLAGALTPELLSRIPTILTAGARTTVKDATVVLLAELRGKSATAIQSRRDAIQPTIDAINSDEAAHAGVFARLEAAIVEMQGGQDAVLPSRAELLDEMGLEE